MDSHNPEVFSELLDDFRNGFAKFGDSAFILEALSEDEEQSLPDGFRNSLLDTTGSIVAPGQQWRVWGSGGGPVNYPNREVYAKLLEFSRSGIDCFAPLARRAGAHLPPTVRTALPFSAVDAQSYWTSLLWWLQIPCDDEFTFQVCRRRIVAASPFEDSARVIERLRLATDSPEMPIRVYLTGDQKDSDIIYERANCERSLSDPPAKPTNAKRKSKFKTVAAKDNNRLWQQMLDTMVEHWQSSRISPKPMTQQALAKKLGIARRQIGEILRAHDWSWDDYKDEATEAHFPKVVQGKRKPLEAARELIEQFQMGDS